MTQSESSFPRLIIRAGSIEARGPFAEAQATYLNPDAETTKALGEALREKRIGVVAHFYMDAELQGVLAACEWPHIHISDSLVMADRAVSMTKEGVEAIIVLGVDFMSENVRAMLDASGFSQIPVYRAATAAIGCSLAESAEKPAYRAYLERARDMDRALHVVYINTSLMLKAQAQSMVPTITCTSSNVVKTVLSAFAEIPELDVFFGPDTYMGQNLTQLFQSLIEMDEGRLRALHPAHTHATIRALLPRFHYFEEGVCVVHHMFGAEVARRVVAHHGDAHIAAHLEVPGEMFSLALAAQAQDRGVVGSTSDILGFIARRVTAATRGDADPRQAFVLGTESGMVTSIVKQVRAILGQPGADPATEVEIIFPVASEAISRTDDADLAIVPGIAGGEGCSTAGGCATCPYMKMNSLDGLEALIAKIGQVDAPSLAGYEPRTYREFVQGRPAAELGTVPILHMRAFQRDGRLPPALVQSITGP